VRAVALGLLLVPLLCWWTLKQALIHGGTEFVEASLVLIAVFTLFLLVLLNQVVRRVAPRFAFSPAEHLTVYAMLTVSLGVAGLGGLQVLPQALGAVFYFAAPENGWADLHPLIPSWLVPDPSVLEAFYKGNSTLFTGAHLLGWALPAVVWSLFFLAMLFATFCLSVMIRKPWVEQERLTFPLVYLPLELTRAPPRASDPCDRPGARPQAAPGFAPTSRGFWAGFLLVCCLRSVTGLHHLVPSFPDLAEFDEEGQSFPLDEIFVERPWSAIGYSRLSFHPLVIGLTYFLPREIAFSGWFFYLATLGERILAAAYGWEPSGGSMGQPPYLGEQGGGAFLMVALLSLLHARRHLAAVWRKAFAGDPKVDDHDEPLSYRAAVFGFLGALAVLVGFLAAARLAAPLALLFLALFLLFMLTATRLRAEAGPMLIWGPEVNPHRLMVDLPGTRHWSAQHLMGLSTLQWFDTDYRTAAMPQQLEAFKLAESARIPSRRLSPWLLAATALAVVASWVAVLAIYYHYGASTPRGGNSWRIEMGRFPFETLSGWLSNPTETDWPRVEWVLVGAAIAAGLVHLRRQFLWWPFHPSGYVLAHAGLSMTWVWFPMLIGWVLKSAILRYGGMPLYRRAIPFFVGLILGDIIIGIAWALLGTALNVDVYMFFPG
jgi:hypothetical protein